MRAPRPAILVACTALASCLPYQVGHDRPNGATASVAWARRFGDGTDQQVRGLAIDPDGNLVVAGDFVGTIPELGGINAAFDALPFVAKLSPSGELSWSRVIHGGGSFRVWDVAASRATGVIAIGGNFVAPDADIGGVAGGIETESGTMLRSSSDVQADGFVVLVNPNGKLLWTRRIGGGGLQRIRAVEFYSDGGGERRVATFGDFKGELCLDDPQLCRPTSELSSDGLLVTFREDGSHYGVRTLVGPGEQFAAALAVDGRDGVIAGTSGGTVQFATRALATHGSSDIFLAKINLIDLVDPSWAASFGSAEPNCYPECEVVASVDSAHRTIVAGTVNGALDVGGGEMFASPLSPDMFVAAYDREPIAAAPHMLWSRQIGGPSDEVRPYGIATTPHDDIVVAGLFGGTLDVAGSSWTNADSAHDAFVLGLHPGGAVAWAMRLPITFAKDDPKPPPPIVVATDAAGAVYLAGSFRGVVQIGEHELRAAGTQGADDFFIAKLVPPSE